MLNLPNSGDADPGPRFEFSARQAKLRDADSDEPGEFQPVFRVNQTCPAPRGPIALALSLTCHENPPRTPRQIADIARHAKPQMA